MNDRVSLKPPVPYIGTEEEINDRYDSDNGWDNRGRRLAQSRKGTHTRNASGAESSVMGRSETSRHSSIFRFGKSIAASFNPSNWKIWSKNNQDSEDEETVQQQILRERQEKAEQIYKELKQSGHFNGALNSGAPRFVKAEDLKEPPRKHDSGVDLGDGKIIGAPGARHSIDMSRDEKRRGRVSLEAPKVPGSHRGRSPGVNGPPSFRESTPSRPSFNLARASLSNIKKAFTSDSEATSSYDGQQARRIPSRKDLQKQQKLVKRVSDLEGKLEAARRQLADAASEPVPHQTSKFPRNKYVPRGLPTLPSERLLGGYVSSEGDLGDTESHNDIGWAVTVDDSNSSFPLMSGARGDEDMSKTILENKATSTEKPLPNPPSAQEKVIQSVETDARDPTKNKTKQDDDAASVTTESSEVSSTSRSNYEEEAEVGDSESDNESTPRARPSKPTTPPKKTQPAPAPRRKRKSNTFERLADDGGRYKPTKESASEAESDLSLATKKKKLNTKGPPRKLQKVVQEPSPPKLSNPRKSSVPVPARRTGKLVKTIASRTTNTHIRQSASPPPSSSFTGLDYKKPSSTTTTKSGGKEVAYIADPSSGHGVPPMPKMPSSIRLASGEMVNTGASAAANKSELPRSEPSFVWDEDVF